MPGPQSQVGGLVGLVGGRGWKTQMEKSARVGLELRVYRLWAKDTTITPHPHTHTHTHNHTLTYWWHMFTRAWLLSRDTMPYLLSWAIEQLKDHLVKGLMWVLFEFWGSLTGQYATESLFLLLLHRSTIG